MASVGMKTLSELAKLYCKKQPHEVDEILEEAPILSWARFAESTHDFHNVAEQVTDVVGAGWVKANSRLPAVDADTNLVKVDLSIMGGQMEVPHDTAQFFGGASKYFAKKLPKIRKKTGMGTEQHLIYNVWKPAALAHDMVYSASPSALPAGTPTMSIIFVRQVDGENNGLFSPKGMNQGTILKLTSINNGAYYHSVDPQLQGVLVQGAFLKAYLGWQVLSTRTVGAIVNITPDTLPTELMIDEVLADIRATNSGATAMIMHPKCRILINKFKTDRIRTTFGERAIQTYWDTWNGVPIMETYNMITNEMATPI